VCREDAVVAMADREALLELAPEREGEFIRVPKILTD
jgi:Asp-tRNA(Asn)/Glu-tRNA(Gln) amidotransferase C subunit